MRKCYYFLLILCMAYPIASARSKEKGYSIKHDRQRHKVYQRSSHIGQLDDGTWVKLVCIKKDALGMPNVTLPSYRGMFINEDGKKCYVFILESDGKMYYQDQDVNVYRVNDEGFLEDGTKVRVACLPPGIVAKVAYTPDFMGTYQTDEQRQCNVYTSDKMPTKKMMPPQE